MTIRFMARAVALGALGFIAPDAGAAAYIKFDGIKGESTATSHRQWIDVVSVDWGAQRLGGSALRRPSETAVQELAVGLRPGAASPLLMAALASGRVFASVQLELTDDASGATYYGVVLQDVVVSSYSTSGAGAGAPVDAVKLAFGRMTWTAIPQDPTQPPTVFQWSRTGP